MIIIIFYYCKYKEEMMSNNILLILDANTIRTSEWEQNELISHTYGWWLWMGIIAWDVYGAEICVLMDWIQIKCTLMWYVQVQCMYNDRRSIKWGYMILSHLNGIYNSKEIYLSPLASSSIPYSHTIFRTVSTLSNMIL